MAGWRLASLIVSEDGPFAVFARIRRRVGVEEPGEITGLAKLFSCVWCASVYTCALLAAVLLPWDEWWVPGVLAASAVAIIVDRWAQG